MDKFERRMAGGEWEEVDRPEDDAVCFAMDDHETDNITFDTPLGKFEYRRVRD